MRSEYEKEFGDTLHFVVGHLIKNAIRVPSPLLQGALAFESFTWAELPDAEKTALVRGIAEQSEPPSAIHRHFESYPHHYSKEQFTRFLRALKFYKGELGL